ncbi:DUF2236 domain-containing protein [Mycobacterium sp. OAE908]|uniref:oxygenase MpaB family protein n=1 Tax=Mycobacterium sp. OAE908 TaxID=2817899 RepID=UPI001AE815EB
MFAPFAGAFFDQVMLPEVAAGVEWTGRIRNTPFERAMRSAAADQLAFVGSAADNKAFGEWLRQAHRDVKGTGPNGVRFSALNPESWNWIMTSAIIAFQNAYTPITGQRLTDAERQEFYEFLLEKFEHVQLSGKHSRLPGKYRELLNWYDSVLDGKGEHNITVANAVDTLRHPPFPPFLPNLMKPVWRPIGELAGHLASVYSFGIMRPKARALTGYSWTGRHAFQFRLYTAILPTIYRRAPKRLTMAPMAYHYWRYSQLADQYRSMQLDNFAPSCPAGGSAPVREAGFTPPLRQPVSVEASDSTR